MAFTIRTTSPAGQYLKYYMQQGTYPGALNSSILGNGAVPGANVLQNCVGYSQGRALEMYEENTGQTLTSNPFSFLNVDAENWYSVAAANGLPVGQTPQPGAIGVYRRVVGGVVTIGHVCNIEAYINGIWHITESHYYYDGGDNTHGSWDYSYLSPANLKPLFIANDNYYEVVGFIYPLGDIPMHGGSGGRIATMHRARINNKRKQERILLL